MTRDQFIAAGNYLYGRHWQQRMAEVLRTQPSTISRWANASTEVSGPASVAVQLLVAAKQG
jgi:hypothetical protein